MGRLKPLKIKWGCQSTLFLGDDEEMVKLAADSGCVSVFVGMESLDEESLDETNKPFNRVHKFSKRSKCSMIMGSWSTRDRVRL